MTFARIVNDRILALFNLRLTRASTWRKLEDEQRRLESLARSALARARILQLASVLVPKKAVGQSKVRLGSKCDGGYVCLDDFDGITAAFSFGVAENDDWDVDVADRGIVVYQFDHTVESPPHRHANFRFQKKKIVPIKDGASDAESISSLLTQHVSGGMASAILKIDVEHDEWQIFLSTSNDDLRKFSQIICEFHGFSEIDNDTWYDRARTVLEKLHQDFEIVHVHGNNCSRLIAIGNIPFPELLEVTYASRSRYTFEPADEIFPTQLDAPNEPNRPDLELGWLTLFDKTDPARGTNQARQTRGGCRSGIGQE
jgi:hypothetical protein